MYFVNDFKTSLLINNDTFKFQRVIIDYNKETTFLGFCHNYIIFIEIRTRDSFNAKRIFESDQP